VFIITEHSQKMRIKKFDSRNQNFIKFDLWIMMKHCILLTFFILSLGSCNPEPSDKSDGTPDYIKWEVTLPQDDDFITIHDPIIYNEIIILPIDDQGVLLALDKLTGDELWRWTEARDTYDGADGFGRWSYIYDNILVIGHRNIFYGLNVETGETIWHENYDLQAITNLFGLEDKVAAIFRIANELVSYELIDIRDGTRQQIIQFDREDIYNVSGHIPKLYEYNNIRYLSFVRKKWISASSGYEEHGWLYNYNLTEDKIEWISDTIPKNSPVLPVPGFLPRVANGKILIESNSIQAYSIETGELDWIDNSHTNTFAWNTHLTAADGKVFGNNENGYMIALDVETGAELWRTDTGGTGSRIEYHDEKLYIAQITGYYSEELNAYSPKSSLLVLDANTGEVLHHLQSPYEDDGDHRYWDDVITVDQETGLIYTADHNKVMCIELDD